MKACVPGIFRPLIPALCFVGLTVVPASVQETLELQLADF